MIAYLLLPGCFHASRGEKAMMAAMMRSMMGEEEGEEKKREKEEIITTALGRIP